MWNNRFGCSSIYLFDEEIPAHNSSVHTSLQQNIENNMKNCKNLSFCLCRSYGCVFKANYKETGEIVAIKQVPVESDLQEIIKEISIMQQCNRYCVYVSGVESH